MTYSCLKLSCNELLLDLTESREYATLVKHSEESEIALSSETNILYFLIKEKDSSQTVSIMKFNVSY